MDVLCVFIPGRRGAGVCMAEYSWDAPRRTRSGVIPSASGGGGTVDPMALAMYLEYIQMQTSGVVLAIEAILENDKSDGAGYEEARKALSKIESHHDMRRIIEDLTLVPHGWALHQEAKGEEHSGKRAKRRTSDHHTHPDGVVEKEAGGNVGMRSGPQSRRKVLRRRLTGLRRRLTRLLPL